MAGVSMTDENYTITISRTNSTEFEASYDRMPEDAFGKRMVAMVLMNISSHLDPALNDLVGDYPND